MYHKHSHTDAHRYIRHVKDGKINQSEVKKINNVPEPNPIDEVTDRAAYDKRKARFLPYCWRAAFYKDR